MKCFSCPTARYLAVVEAPRACATRFAFGRAAGGDPGGITAGERLNGQAARAEYLGRRQARMFGGTGAIRHDKPAVALLPDLGDASLDLIERHADRAGNVAGLEA